MPVDWEGIYCEAVCTDVYDGDTITLKVDISNLIKKYYPNNLDIIAKLPESYTYLKCRMLGYNCAEIKSNNPKEREQALKDKEFLTQQLLGKKVTCDFSKTDNYGRVLTYVFLDNPPICINETMLQLGHARCSGKRDGFNYVNYS